MPAPSALPCARCWTRPAQRRRPCARAGPPSIWLPTWCSGSTGRMRAPAFSAARGPPRLSFFGIPGMDERANAVEFFVHHEDVRRAQPGWQPRAIGHGLSEELWRRLKMARMILRKAPVGVEFARSDEPSPSRSGAPSIRLTAHARTPIVTVTGTPAELTLWALGRTAAARVRLDGSEDDVRALSAARWRS